MKKVLLILSVSALSIAAFSQGLINFGNTIATKISTNTVAAGGLNGVIVGANQYYFALLTAPSTVTTVDARLQELLSSTWTFTGLYATNTFLGGRLAGGSGVPATGWLPAQTNSYIVVGWSANMGATWSAIAALLNGATFTGGWYGGGLTRVPGWLGASTVGFGQAGGVDPTSGQSLQPWSLFGAAANSGGTPITTGFTLYVVGIPEPSPIALLWLGVIVVMLGCRK